MITLLLLVLAVRQILATAIMAMRVSGVISKTNTPAWLLVVLSTAPPAPLAVVGKLRIQ
jgi:hypothetical protein